MSPSSPRPMLVGLALLAAVATVERVVGLSAPMPTADTPSVLRLAGYRVRAMEGKSPRQGRELSHGELRRFRLEPLSGETPLTLSLMEVRSRTGTEISEHSKERKGLNMVAVGHEVPSFALYEKRVLSLPRPNAPISGPKLDQIALGRGREDPAGSITRLQTCLAPSGVVALSSSTLVGQGRERTESVSPLVRHALRLVGWIPSRHECLAVQLDREHIGGAQVNGGAADHQRELVRVWRELRGVLGGA